MTPVQQVRKDGKVVDGIYTVRFYVPGGKGKKRITMRVPAGSLLEAVQMEKKLKESYGIKQKNGFTIGAIWEKYLEHLRQNTKSPRTIKDKQQCFMVRLLPYFGRMLADAITNEQIENYKKQRLVSSPGRVRQINKELVYLSAMINWAADPRVQLCREKAKKYFPLAYKPTARQFLSKEQVLALIDHTDLAHQVIFLAMSHGGLRVQEVLALKWTNVNLESGYLGVRGKGDKARLVPLPDIFKAKFQEYRDQILIPPDVSMYKETYHKRRDILHNWNNFISRYAPSGKLSGEEWCFPNYKDPELHLTDIKHSLHNAAERANIGKWVTPHMLRHSYATMLLSSGADIRVIQALLGHSSITTTQIYAKVDVSLLKRTTDKL